MAICDKQRCKRKAEVAPKLIVPRRIGAEFDKRYDYILLLGVRLCRRCHYSLIAAPQASMPKTAAFIRAEAQARAKRAMRPYEEPDFGRAKLECVRLDSKEYRRVAPQFAGDDIQKEMRK